MKIILLLLLLITRWQAIAQSSSVVMSINGKVVTREEFEYAYKKNNKGSQHISVTAFAKQYAVYKQKVAAAEEAQLDELSSLNNDIDVLLSHKEEPKTYIKDNFKSTPFEQNANLLYRIYNDEINNNGGLFRYGEIFLSIKQHSTAYEEDKIHLLADSIYIALQHGDNFETLAKKYSNRKEEGVFFIATKNNMLEDVDKVLSTMKVGEICRPIRSPFGLHILKLIGRENFPTYKVIRPQLILQIEKSNLRKQIIEQQQNKIPYTETISDIDKKRKANTIIDENLRREIHDGLLVAAITQRKLDSLLNNEKELQHYFSKHKKIFRNINKNKSNNIISFKDNLPLIKICYKQFLEHIWEKELKHKYNVVFNKKELSIIRKIFKANEDK
ncbi:peptidylprolyl isomerase [Prevotella amnii]|uniref:peptidylprolyl isomerase n=1 Tax=Prevotella amnii TaxID=419005 RepID=UPI00336A9268